MRASFLLVDDSKSVRVVVNDMLVAAGVMQTDIRTATNGTEALQMFEESPADVVLLDIEMPGAECREVAARMLDARPRTKIVVMTAMPRDDPRVRAIVGMGGYEVIEKPVRPERLSQLVHAIQSGSREVGRLR